MIDSMNITMYNYEATDVSETEISNSVVEFGNYSTFQHSIVLFFIFC